MASIRIRGEGKPIGGVWLQSDAVLEQLYISGLVVNRQSSGIRSREAGACGRRPAGAVGIERPRCQSELKASIGKGKP